MLYLILSILCSTSLIVILRLFSNYKIKTEYGIVFNYAVCCITGFIAMDDKSMLLQIPSWNGWWVCLMLGLGFTLIFILVGKSTKMLGVATTSIAFKLSFIIPTLVAILFYGNTLTLYKTIGIVAAVIAVYFITYQKGEIKEKKDEDNEEIIGSKNTWLLPVMIFVGAGIADSIFNIIQRNYSPPNFDHIVTFMIFFGAFISGMILYGFNKEMYSWKNLVAGIALGVPNYGSLYFLLQALKHTGYAPSTLFPINNLGIVGVSAIIGLLIFKESFSANKIIGFVLAIASIVLIGFVK